MAQNAPQSLVERLFEAGAHFGFSRSRRHPSVKPYLFGSKQGTDIFDLEKSSELLAAAAAFLTDTGSKGKKVLFAGTKEEIGDLVVTAASSVSMPVVTNRWIGGTLTNFSEIKKRIDRLALLKSQRASGELDRKYTKKERLLIEREVEKLEYNFGGITTMEHLPGAVVVVDPRHEEIAIAEARQMNIPTVALMSSDCDLSLVTYPIVVNDSNRASVELVLKELVAAYEAGVKTAPARQEARPARKTAEVS